MRGALKDLPPRRKRQGSGEQDRDRRETQQGSIAGAVPASARSLQQLWSIKQTSGSTIKPRGWASVPQASTPRHSWLSVGPLGQAVRLQCVRTSL